MHLCSHRLFRIARSVTAAIVYFLHSANAATPVAGDISGMTFESSGNPHIVEQDLLISEGKKATIREGCVFLFKSFTGMNVFGDLLVEGTQEHPVAFTSINDREYNPQSEQLPNPFDWNGIFVSKESGNVSLKHFILRFSVYGIKSQNTHLVLDNGQFRQNGQFHFTLNDKIQNVQDNFPFSFNTLKPQPDPATPPPGTTRSALVNKGVPTIIAAAGVAGGVVSLVYLSKWTGLRDEYRATADPAKARKLEQDAEFPSYVAIGSGAVSIAAVATGAVLYWWWNMRKEQPMTLTPVILPDRTGAMITITLRQ
ncbi:MAG: hypothetical protein JW915_08810 [Chitinispirillaceae bacterium]|nr:hypothetical protein [Chitinispirillaceae bacterium]